MNAIRKPFPPRSLTPLACENQYPQMENILENNSIHAGFVPQLLLLSPPKINQMFVELPLVTVCGQGRMPLLSVQITFDSVLFHSVCQYH